MTFKAGFDLSEISVENWQLLLRNFNIGVEPLKTDKGWEWRQNDENFVVTANNPITGLYYHDRNGTDKPVKDYVGYVGIEGDKDFVKEFFHSFECSAEHYKEAVFGRRDFI